VNAPDDPTTYDRWLARTIQGGFTPQQAALIVDIIGMQAEPTTLARLLDEGVWPAGLARAFTAEQASAILLLAGARAGHLRRLPPMLPPPEWSFARDMAGPSSVTRQDLDEAVHDALNVMTWRMMGIALVLLGLLAWWATATGAPHR
jgi:hypothetical protein